MVFINHIIMTREEKIIKRKTRAAYRANKRAEKYRTFLNKNTDAINKGGFYIAKRSERGGCWEDSDSPTGYSQVCSYQGICQYPCNGDC